MPIYKNLRKIVRNVKFSLQGISVKSAIYLMITIKKKKSIIVTGVVFVELVEEINHSIVTNVSVVLIPSTKTTTRVHLLSKIVQSVCKICMIPGWKLWCQSVVTECILNAYKSIWVAILHVQFVKSR